MTTNLGKEITHHTKKDYSKFNMVRNEPVQTHFSAEGVQIYSLADIQALKMIAERKMQKLPEGEFVKPKEYRVDFAERDIDELLTRPATADNWRGRLTQKTQAKVRLEKENLKSSTVQKKLFKLSELRKEIEVKEPAKPAKEFVKPPRRCEMEDRDIAYTPEPNSIHDQDFAVEEAEGDNNALPADMKISMMETEGEQVVKAMDSSFEEVEMEGLVVDAFEAILNKSDFFTSRLNNAISSLTEEFSTGPTKNQKKQTRSSKRA